jgi:hypothetical protein
MFVAMAGGIAVTTWPTMEEVEVTASGMWPDGESEELARMVARLRVEPGSQSAPDRRRPDRARQRLSNGAFSTFCLAVILPLSIVLGGWLGLIVGVVAIAVAVRIVLDEQVPSDARADQRRMS